MSGIVWRILIAVVACVFAWAILPPFIRIVGLDLSGDVLTVIRLCIGAIAVFYVISGPNPPWRRTP